MRYPGNVFTFVLAFAAAAAAHAEIYKCTTKAGMTLYQNFPCAIDSIGSSAVVSGSAPAPRIDAQSAPKPAVVATAKSAAPGALPAKPDMGMTSDQVRAIWGDPTGVDKEEFAKDDIETWTYADSRSITFDRTGQVTAIRW